MSNDAIINSCEVCFKGIIRTNILNNKHVQILFKLSDTRIICRKCIIKTKIRYENIDSKLKVLYDFFTPSKLVRHSVQNALMKTYNKYVKFFDNLKLMKSLIFVDDKEPLDINKKVTDKFKLLYRKKINEFSVEMLKCTNKNHHKYIPHMILCGNMYVRGTIFEKNYKIAEELYQQAMNVTLKYKITYRQNVFNVFSEQYLDYICNFYCYLLGKTEMIFKLDEHFENYYTLHTFRGNYYYKQKDNHNAIKEYSEAYRIVEMSKDKYRLDLLRTFAEIIFRLYSIMEDKENSLEWLVNGIKYGNKFCIVSLNNGFNFNLCDNKYESSVVSVDNDDDDDDVVGDVVCV